MRYIRPRSPVSDAARRRVMDTLAHALGARKEALFAYLHGSYAEGRPFRDLDIAVYVDESTLSGSLLACEVMLESELEKAIRGAGLAAPLDLRILNRAPLSFRYEVIKHGTPVFVGSDDLRVDFEAATISRYFDFAPFRREQLQEVLGLETE